MAAVILLSQLYNRPVHICHVAKKEEVGVADVGVAMSYSLHAFVDIIDQGG